MNRIYKILLVLSIMTILTGSTLGTPTKTKFAPPDMVQKHQQDIFKELRNKSDSDSKLDNIPIDITTIPPAQLAYNDLYTFTDKTLNDVHTQEQSMPYTLMTRYVTLRYPSTLAITFSSEIQTQFYDYYDPDDKITYTYPGFATVGIYIDGVEIAPGSVFYKFGYTPYEDAISVHSFTFRNSYVPAGKHKIEVKASAEAYFWWKSLIVYISGSNS